MPAMRQTLALEVRAQAAAIGRQARNANAHVLVDGEDFALVRR